MASRLMRRGWLFVGFAWVLSCAEKNDQKDPEKREVPEHGAISTSSEDLKIDPKTGVPYALTFQFPIKGFDTSDFGFGFGSVNDHFCMAWSDGNCVSYGAHLGRDTQVKKTPVGTEVLAPADGIVRVTTTQTFGAFGSDSSKNPNYKGCLILLEHEFANGSPVTTLLGHIQCESGVAYDPAAKTGNPPVGSVVKRGQYVAHVNHYWSGSGMALDWHHLHWAMRRGAYSASKIGEAIRGYATLDEFSVDPGTQAKAHPSWIDPFTVVASNGDPAIESAADVRHHPPGSLLEDPDGGYWSVVDESRIAFIPPEVFAKDRYETARSVKVKADEIGCYSKAPQVQTTGNPVLYKRAGSPTVVMAYPSTLKRYEVIRWEALLSWGFDSSDLISDSGKISLIEQTYQSQGYRLLRPGSLVKSDEESEVSIVTPQQTRLPIGSGETFEALGFRWEHVVSLPGSVLDVVAGARQSVIVDWDSIHRCAVSTPCPSGGVCGGGDPGNDGMSSMPVEGNGGSAGSGGKSAPAEACNGQDDDGNGSIDEIFPCKLGDSGGSCVTSCGVPGYLVCVAPTCSLVCQPFSEICGNGVDDDCNGQADCADTACAKKEACLSSASGSGGVSGSGGSVGSAGSSAGGPSGLGGNTAGALAALRLTYEGPAMPGVIELDAWWQPPMQATRTWGAVTECVDVVPGDAKLDCTFHLPHGTAPLEFQVALPDGRYWGDASCWPTGGCGKTIGTVVLSDETTGMVIPFDLVPNKPGEPYLKAQVKVVP